MRLRSWISAARQKMAGGHVNADMEIARGREIAYLPHRFADDVAGKRNNQVMFFGQRDKDIGRNPSLTRVVPAQEDLDADAFPGAGIQQRLAEELKLPGRNSILISQVKLMRRAVASQAI